MKQRARETWAVLREACQSFARHLGVLKAGAIAFFATLSLFPLGLLLVSVVGRAMGSEKAYRQVEVLTEQYLPGAADQVIAALGQARGTGGHLAVNALGAFVLLWSGASLFVTLSQVLTVVWVGELRCGFLRRRLVSFAAVLVAGVLFVASIVTTSLLAAVSSYAGSVEAVAHLYQQLRFLESAAVWGAHAAVVAAVLFLLYWTMPACPVPARAALVAAVPAALLWMVSRSIFAALVAGSSRHGQLYGPLAGAVILLVWIYCSALIMIFCGEVGATAQRRYWPPHNRT